MTEGGGLNATSEDIEVEAEFQLFGLGLVLIPTATILGNLLVIISVLRFRTLHSAINFLILGLAVADLFVALFVMPYAVYVYVQGGYWFLGPLMCDIYSASDVACSTASILLLAVISFDRYRAVSRPIQYSRTAQNTKRVMVILVAIWLISLALASPIVLGVNYRPPDADLYECRFYNADFSIISSIFSFIIPLVIVLFVYIKILVALRKRERAAKQRRLNNLNSSRRETDRSYDEGDEAGQAVTGPDEHDLAGSSTPHSSSESLSENLNIIANDFVSEGPTISRKSSDDDESLATRTLSSFNSFATPPNEQKPTKRFHFGRSLRKKHSAAPLALSDVDLGRKESSENFLPTLLRQISKRSPRIFRKSIGEKLTGCAHTEFRKSSDSALSVIQNANVVGNGATRIPRMDECIAEESERPHNAQTELDTLTSSGVAKLGNGLPHDATTPEVISRIPLVKSAADGHSSISRLPISSIDAISDRKDSKSLVIANEEAAKRLSSSTENRSTSSMDKTSSAARRISAISDAAYRNVSTSRVPSSISSNQISGEAASKKLSSALKAARRIRSQQSMDSLVGHALNTSSNQNSKRKLLTTAKQNGSTTALAVRIVKKTISRKDASFKRKVTKAQRKERRATKTLGIVVGIFLICWVPFFSINIINAVCIKLENPSCQVGYGPFFYATWVGYMNSFMNPVIYTIFNPEFRRAFLKLARLRNNGCFVRSRNSAIL